MRRSMIDADMMQLGQAQMGLEEGQVSRSSEDKPTQTPVNFIHQGKNKKKDYTTRVSTYGEAR